MFTIGLLFVLIWLPFAASAQYIMPFEAKPLSSWYSKYLTITNLYNEFFYQMIDSETESRGKFRLGLFDVITAVNGTDTSEISIMDFEKLCSQSDTLHLSIMRKMNGEDLTIKCSILQKNNRNGYGDLLDNIKEQQQIREEIGMDNTPDGIRVIKDGGIDFASINTYDFMITGDDPLTDKKILEAFCRSGQFGRLKRDEENPDIIVCVAKNANESISSTYVPPTTQVVNTGSVTRPVYNYITHTTSFVTQQRNRYETSGGYTQTTTNTNIYLEFSILDAKKLNDPAQKTAPIIWKMTYTRNVANRAFEILDEYLAVASWNFFPFTFNPCESVSFWFVGTRFNHNTVSSDVVPNTPAAKLGLQKGDKIIKVNGKKKYKHSVIRHEFYPKYKYIEEKTHNEIGFISGELSRRSLVILENKFNQNGKGVNYNVFGQQGFRSDLYDEASYTVLRNGREITLKGYISPSIARRFRDRTVNPEQMEYVTANGTIRAVDQN